MGQVGTRTLRLRAQYRLLLAIGLSWFLLGASHAQSLTGTPTPPEADELQEITVNGVPLSETVLPTRLPDSSSLGLDLSIMDTPRSATLLSATQLQTVNVSDPRAISFFTSSSFTDSSYGTVAVPLIRTQTADIYYNGMRNSLNSGYGAPVNFDSLANMAITKGPASVNDGPGPGVGGKVDFLTKRPDMYQDTAQANVTFDSLRSRRWVFDVGAPIIKGDLAVLFSYSGEDSSSYFFDHFKKKEALYGALKWTPSDQYTLELIGEVNYEHFTTMSGVNRDNQALIDSGQYLTGTVLATGFTEPQPFGTVFNTTGVTRLNPKVTLDETPGDTLIGQLFNAQLIQTFRFNDHLALENNTLFLKVNSATQDQYYYSDSSNGSYSIESKTDLKGDFDMPLAGLSMHNQFIGGGTLRVQHTNTIINYSAEPVSVWDLSGNPNAWQLDPALQPTVDASPYRTAVGEYLYGVPGRDSSNAGGTGVSDLYDAALFFEDRIEFTPKLSTLFGYRIDAVKDHTRDPLACVAGAYSCLDAVIPSSHTSAIYGDGDGNLSLVYKFIPQISAYATVDWVQAPPAPNAALGGINVYGYYEPDKKLLRGNSKLYEVGMKFNLLDQKLFASTALFQQTHAVPIGPGGVESAGAKTRGVEVELNYQPNRNLFATASYSYLTTTLDSAAPFYDFPAQLGTNIDGEGYLFAFPAGKYKLPGLPEHLFNFLGNYKFDNGFGVRTGLQVTGPIETTTSGTINVAALASTLESYGLPVVIPNSISVNAANPGIGYYHSPVIPWQYTWNAAAFYTYGPYTATFSVYNVTDERNWVPAPPGNGNDFLVRSDPRSFEIRLQAKF